MPTWPSPRSEQLGAPNPPAIRFARGTHFGASRFTHLLRPAKLFAPLYGSDRYARPPRAFTSRLPTDRLPSPLLDMTTTVTGLLCWRDFHPLEWQLASLHGHGETNSAQSFLVRSTSVSGPSGGQGLRATSGALPAMLAATRAPALLDDHIGGDQKRVGDGETERLSG